MNSIQRTKRLPQWVGQLARVSQVFLSKVQIQYALILPNMPNIPKFASHQIMSDFRRLRAPSYFVSSETAEVCGFYYRNVGGILLLMKLKPPHFVVCSGLDVALSIKKARLHNIHCRPVESCCDNLLQDGDGDRGEGVRDQVRHCPCLLPGWKDDNS